MSSTQMPFYGDSILTTLAITMNNAEQQSYSRAQDAAADAIPFLVYEACSPTTIKMPCKTSVNSEQVAYNFNSSTHS